MFSTDTFVKAKIRDVIVLSQKNRKPDEAPGAKFTLEMQIENRMLAHFDGNLKAFLFTASPANASKNQAELDGVEPVSDMPNLTNIGMKCNWLTWGQEMPSYTVEVDHGLGGKSNLKITDCLLSAWRMLPKEGGSVIIRSSVESADVTEAQFGRLSKLKSRDVLINFIPPTDAQLKLLEEQQQREGGAGDDEAKGEPKTATDAFVERHAPPANGAAKKMPKTSTPPSRRPIAKAPPAKPAKTALRKRAK